MAKIVQLREMLDEETYRAYEKHWSDIRMSMDYEPLPHKFEDFKKKLGWEDINDPS